MQKVTPPTMFIFAITVLFSVNTLLFSQSWTSQSSGTVNILEAVWFTDAQNGWVVGNSGTSIFTSDGGQTWDSVNLSSEDLKDVAFAGQSIGVIVGDNGRIFRTTDGGANWSQISSGTTSNILAFAFGEGGMAYAAGRDAVILRSSDSGASWSVIETGTTRYRSAAAKGSQNAWVVGEDGNIRATTDGGINWNDQSSGTSSDLHDVFFLTVTEGWIAGQNDMLLYTNDGGATWSSRNTGIDVGLEGIYFVNSNDGWAVGNAGRIFTTTDGGLNWLSESTGSTLELNDVFFVDTGNGWSVGDNGTILNRSTITGINDNVDSVPTEFSLEQNYPNPFNPTTEIVYEVPEVGRSVPILLRVFNILGQPVRTLVDATLAAGVYKVTWHGTNDAGTSLPAGIYFYRFEAGNSTLIKKMTLLK